MFDLTIHADWSSINTSIGIPTTSKQNYHKDRLTHTHKHTHTPAHRHTIKEIYNSSEMVGFTSYNKK